MGTPPDWLGIDLADLFPVISQTLDGQLEALNEGAQALKATNENIRDAVNQKIDELNALINSVNDGLASIKNNLDSTGIFLLTVVPDDINDTGGLSGFVAKLQASFDDEDDPNRPTFDNSAFIGAVVILTGAPSLEQVNDVIAKATAFITLNPLDLPVIDKLQSF